MIKIRVGFPKIIYYILTKLILIFYKHKYILIDSIYFYINISIYQIVQLNLLIKISKLIFFLIKSLFFTKQ